MTATNNRFVLASRGSKLALSQAESIAEMLHSSRPGVEIEIRTVKTRGDKDARPFGAIGSKGIFMAEVEREVVEGRADFAVHSAKDLTAELYEGCVIVCVPPRAAPHDVVVGSEGASGEERLGRLASGATVGTSSIRRRALLSEVRPDLEVVDFRGNIDTRLQKVADGEVEAAILAAAGIARLGRNEGAALDPERWVPAPAQGALAIEANSDRDDVAELFFGLGDPGAMAEIRCERAFAAALEGGCSIPLGCLARADGNRLAVFGYLGHPEGAMQFRDRISGPADAAEDLGRELGMAIIQSGGAEILEELREQDESDYPAPSAP
jgi:hydroxymethylbilane synthase